MHFSGNFRNLLRVKQLLYITLALWLPLVVVGQESNGKCKTHFEGTWSYTTQSSISYVVRTLNKQLEYIENGKYYYEFNIEWLSDCKYKLQYVGTTGPQKAFVEVGETFTVEIIKINRSRMKYQTLVRDLEETGEMIKIKADAKK